jgi:hypothetical protein
LVDSDSASVVPSEGDKERTSTLLQEVGDTATDHYDPPEQGPLSRQSTANLRDEQRVLHAQEMEAKLWGSTFFGLYLIGVHGALSEIVIFYGI